MPHPPFHRGSFAATTAIPLPATLPVAHAEILHLRERNEALLHRLRRAVADRRRAERPCGEGDAMPPAGPPPGELAAMLPGARELRVIEGGKA